MKEEPVKKISRLLSAEEAAVSIHRATVAGKRVDRAREFILNYLNEMLSAPDLSAIIKVEKEILTGDLLRYTTSNPMKVSLTTAINEMSVIERHIAIVDNHSEYSAVDRDYSMPKNRKKGLPLDEARQAFLSHFARLNNASKSRLSETEQKIIDIRKSLIWKANIMYIERQAKTLGVEIRQKLYRK